MKTIEAIRKANYERLMAELREERPGAPDKEIARAMGISAAYMSQLKTGIRQSIDSQAARRIERQVGKPEGWIDTDFDLWPFPDASLLAAVEGLEHDQRAEVQMAIRQAIELLNRRTRSGSGESTSSGHPSKLQSAA